MNQETLKAKQAAVAEVKDYMSKSQATIVCEYRGLTVAQIQELRRNLREINAKMGVYKNSVVARAAKEAGNEEFANLMSGPNAVIFSEDVIAGPKAVTKFARLNENLVVKGALVEGRLVDAEGVKTISKLPGKDGLISMFLSVLQAPVRQFACAVKAVADKQNA